MRSVLRQSDCLSRVACNRSLATVSRLKADVRGRSFHVTWKPSSARTNVTVAKEPEYAKETLTGYNVYIHGAFKLSTDVELNKMTVAYETWGELNARKDNAILLQCGMSASSHAASQPKNQSKGWWEDFIGPGKPLDTNLFYVVCTNNLGGCYGSSGPSSINPDTGKPYGSTFPRFDVEDMVRAQFALIDHLSISRLHACVGSSLGGMLSVCSAAMFPNRVAKFVSISACAKSFPGSIAFRHAQRQAVMSDPDWKKGDYYEGDLPAVGLRLARMIGTMTYRSGAEWIQRDFHKRKAEVPRDSHGMKNEFEIEHYLTYQGEKWINTYDPNSMLWISKAMDGFTMEKPDVNGRMSLVEGLKTATQPCLVIGVQHDTLFPVWQQKEIADSLKAAGNKSVAYYELDSVYGHDAFLLEAHSIGPAVKGHLEQEPHGALHLWQDLADKAIRLVRSANSRASDADFLRDVFRILAKNDYRVHCDSLRATMKSIMDVHHTHIDAIFDKHFRSDQEVTLKEFLVILPEMHDLKFAKTSVELGGM